MTELNTNDSLALTSPCLSFSQQICGTVLPTLVSNLEPPILKLPNDLLWRIFWINADLEEEVLDQDDEDEIPALDTLRHSSQVCSRWRQLILSSSSLWGQAINTFSLRQEDWRKEVMRRTGQSLLCVLGSSRRGGLLEDEEVALEIVDHYWDRIRWLELDFTHNGWADGGYDIWTMFRRPSNVLEIFRVMLLTYENGNEVHIPILSEPDFVLFDNLAPALRVFYAPNIKFNLDAPWLSHLRYLSLNAPVSAFDLLRALPHMPLLECLADEDTNAITRTGNEVASLPRIAAPSIDQILIASFVDMRPYIDFLAHINPAPGRALAFIYTGAVPNAETLAAANQILHTYSRCCDLASAIEISITLFQFRFEFEAQFSATGPFRFDLEFTNQGQILSPDTIKTFFTTLPPHTYQEAQTLTLSIARFIIQPSHPKIVEFILSVSSVKVLFTIPETLGFLLALPSDTLAVSFPLLEKVGFTSCPRTPMVSIIMSFLKSRIPIGKPILTLVIPINPNDRTDLRGLDSFTGLKIILEFDGGKDQEYVCGDGPVQDLLIGSREQLSQTEI